MKIKVLLALMVLIGFSFSPVFAGPGSTTLDGNEKYKHYGIKATLARFGGDNEKANKNLRKIREATVQSQDIESFLLQDEISSFYIFDTYQKRSDQVSFDRENSGEAAFQLGEIYENGSSAVSRNVHFAYLAYERALKRGNSRARARLDDILSKMSTQQQTSFDTHRPVPELPAEMYIAILQTKKVPLWKFTLVSKAMKEISEANLLWRPIAAAYGIKKGIPERPLKDLAHARYHLTEAYIAVLKGNSALAFPHINRALQLGDKEDAVREHISGLSGSDYNYQRNPISCREFIEEHAKERNKDAIMSKVSGLAYGHNGYGKNLEACRKFIEELVQEGNKEGIDFKVNGLINGDYGYKKDPEACRKFIEELNKKGNKKTNQYRIDSLGGDLRFGYETDLVASRKLNEEPVEQRNKKSLRHKIHGLCNGTSGYDKDLIAAQEFIEMLVKERNEVGITHKVQGLNEGMYGYEKDPEACREFIEALVREGNTFGINYKLAALKAGNYGYEKSPENLNEFIVEIVRNGNRKSIKSFSLWL